MSYQLEHQNGPTDTGTQEDRWDDVLAQTPSSGEHGEGRAFRSLFYSILFSLEDARGDDVGSMVDFVVLAVLSHFRTSMRKPNGNGAATVRVIKVTISL